MNCDEEDLQWAKEQEELFKDCSSVDGHTIYALATRLRYALERLKELQDKKEEN